ncbi:MAG: flagellar hook-basal body complex protein FliE [Rhodobacteraceae bacterium]|nr:flagellar hook-basal body complex protein FliE [Paracoccaceae bacterium]
MSITATPPLSSPLQQVQRTEPAAIQRPMARASEATEDTFGNRVSEALQSVNDQQQKAAQAARDFSAGRTDDLVGVMVEQQLSSFGFEMTKQVRNRALTAYRDIMNMPV